MKETWNEQETKQNIIIFHLATEPCHGLFNFHAFPRDDMLCYECLMLKTQRLYLKAITLDWMAIIRFNGTRKIYLFFFL